MNGKLAKKIRRAVRTNYSGLSEIEARHKYTSIKDGILAMKRSCATPAKLKPQPVTAGTVPSKFKGFRKVRAPIWYGESLNGLAPTMYGSYWTRNTKSMMG